MEFTPKKEIAKQFLVLVSQGEIDKAFANYVAPNFKHHMPYCGESANDLAEAWKLQRDKIQNLALLRAIEQSDLAMVHAQLKRKDQAVDYLAVYIFRFENHLITELWKVEQEMPLKTQNALGSI